LVNLQRAIAAQQSFGTDHASQGHFHVPADDLYLVHDDRVLHRVDTGTQMKTYGRQKLALGLWEGDMRGVNVIEYGRDADGNRWQSNELRRLDARGKLVAGVIQNIQRKRQDPIANTRRRRLRLRGRALYGLPKSA